MHTRGSLGNASHDLLYRPTSTREGCDPPWGSAREEVAGARQRMRCAPRLEEKVPCLEGTEKAARERRYADDVDAAEADRLEHAGYRQRRSGRPSS